VPDLNCKVRSTPELIEDYFTEFLKKSPKGNINDEYIDDNGAIQLHTGGQGGAWSADAFVESVADACPRIIEFACFHRQRRPRLLAHHLRAPHLPPPGLYTFRVTVNGASSAVPARFNYVYKKQADGKFKSLCHHSSSMPEATAARRLEAGGWLFLLCDFPNCECSRGALGRRARLSAGGTAGWAQGAYASL
jgi:hypothetical protein